MKAMEMPAKEEFEFRKLSIEDIEKCVAFYEQMVGHHRTIYEDDNIPYGDEEKRKLKEKLQNTNNNYIGIVAEKDKKIIGLLTLKIEGKICEIDEILVDKEVRNEGIGHEFAEFAVKTAQERDCSEIQVSFAARNLQALSSTIQ
jgi:ribosomal protein S18 acetylase RimI-like enzyme